MRRLTVTYKTDSGVARTVSLPIQRANALLCAVAIAAMWTVASAGYWCWRGVATVFARNEKALTPISLQNATPPPPVVKVAIPEPEVVAVPVDRPSPAPEVAVAPPPPVTKSLAATLDQVTMASGEQALDVAFGIVNLGQAPLSGEVSGRAVFATNDGKYLDVPAEDEAVFRAKHRSVKTLRFVRPRDSYGEFSSVEIRVKDARGDHELSETYPTP